MQTRVGLARQMDSDTNLFLAVALNEPEKTRIIQLTSNKNAVAPEILPYEIGNALSAMIKRKKYHIMRHYQYLK